MWNFADELRNWGPTSARQCPSLTHAHSYCASLTRRHYENFTVISALLPRELRPHFQAIYAYCRWADDLADETEQGETALAHLAWWRQELLNLYDGRPRHPVMMALQGTVEKYQIPSKPFLNLLLAFEQDQRQKQYDSIDDLVGYCQNSANPVGHLVLYLFESYDDERAVYSDEVCTGLQLANFWQDVARDAAIGRLYLPRADRERFGYSDTDFAAQRCNEAFRELLRFQVQRTQSYFDRGAALLPLIPRRVRVDVELFIRGGEAILRAIERQKYDVWARRPEVSKREKLSLMCQAMLKLMR
jgi:squalene synthase HpnC